MRTKLWGVLLLNGLYALVGLMIILFTLWGPLPDYTSLQTRTIDMVIFCLLGSAILQTLLIILPDPKPQRGWARIRARLLPWGGVQLALFVYCLWVLTTIPQDGAGAQQAYQAVILRCYGLLTIALALITAPEIYRRIVSLRSAVHN